MNGRELAQHYRQQAAVHDRAAAFIRAIGAREDSAMAHEQAATRLREVAESEALAALVQA